MFPDLVAELTQKIIDEERSTRNPTEYDSSESELDETKPDLEEN